MLPHDLYTHFGFKEENIFTHRKTSVCLLRKPVCYEVVQGVTFELVCPGEICGQKGKARVSAQWSVRKCWKQDEVSHLSKGHFKAHVATGKPAGGGSGGHPSS